MDSDPEDDAWDFSTFPGIPDSDGRSDPVSEVVASDDDVDTSFTGAVVPVQKRTVPRRSARISLGEE